MWAQLIGSLLGTFGEAQSAEEQKKMMSDALAKLRNIPLPELKAMVAEQLKNPEAAQQDPALAAAQKEALGQMQGYAKGEISPADRAQMALAENSAAQRGQIQQNAILQGAQQRGQVGSGAQLALQQQAAQGQGENATNLALQNMVNMRNRQFGAVGQAAGMAGQMSNQDFQRKAAADAVAAANARARMQAQGYNLGLGQKQYENQMQQWAAQTGRSDLMGATAKANARDQAGTLGNLGAGFGQMTKGDSGAGAGTGNPNGNSNSPESQVAGTGSNTYTDKYGKLHDINEE